MGSIFFFTARSKQKNFQQLEQLMLTKPVSVTNFNFFIPFGVTFVSFSLRATGILKQLELGWRFTSQ